MVAGLLKGAGCRLKDLDLDADGVDTEEDDEETNSGMYWSAERSAPDNKQLHLIIQRW